MAGSAAVRSESPNSLLEGANTATVIVWYQHACRQSGTYTNGGWRIGIYPRRTACTTQPCRAGTNEPFYFRRLRIDLTNRRACTDPPPFFTDFFLRFLLACVSRPLLGDVARLKESASVGNGEPNRRNFHRKAEGLNRKYVCIRSGETENRAWKLGAFGNVDTTRSQRRRARCYDVENRVVSGQVCIKTIYRKGSVSLETELEKRRERRKDSARNDSRRGRPRARSSVASFSHSSPRQYLLRPFPRIRYMRTHDRTWTRTHTHTHAHARTTTNHSTT